MVRDVNFGRDIKTTGGMGGHIQRVDRFGTLDK
jgi:preprotein translocase subunit YajC